MGFGNTIRAGISWGMDRKDSKGKARTIGKNQARLFRPDLLKAEKASKVKKKKRFQQPA